jgi:hypothetical protein
MELIFVVDSMDDPAVPGLRTLVKEVSSAGRHNVRLQLAESATTCSQKIANQLVRLSSVRLLWPAQEDRWWWTPDELPGRQSSRQWHAR